MPEAKFANLSIEDKAAQLIMIDIPDQELGEKSARHLSAHAWNGIILFAKNVKDRHQVNKLIKDIHKNAKVAPFSRSFSLSGNELITWRYGLGRN